MNERDILIESYMRQRKYTNIMIFCLAILIIGIIGARLNTIAILANDCKMPVYQSTVSNSKTHFTFNNFNEVHYPLLTDIIKSERSDGRINSRSIGDFLIYFGIIGSILVVLALVCVGREKYKYKVLSICEDYKIKCKGVKKK